jgi:hypothetical protein
MCGKQWHDLASSGLSLGSHPAAGSNAGTNKGSGIGKVLAEMMSLLERPGTAPS